MGFECSYCYIAAHRALPTPGVEIHGIAQPHGK